MRILITKDASTKIARDVADLAEAHQVAGTGFHVQVLDDQGNPGPLPPLSEQPPADDAHVAVGSTRFSDGAIQTEESLQQAAAPVAAPAPAKKVAQAKKSAAPKPAAKAPAKAAKKAR